MKRLVAVGLMVGFVACGRSAPGPGARKVISEGALQLVAADLAAFEPKLLEIVAAREGFVSGSDLNGPTASWTVRVPSARFQETIAALSTLGTVSSLHAEAKDVTEQTADTEARLVAKRTEEVRLLKLVESSSGTLADVLAVEKELSRVRGEIEELTGRAKLLSTQVAMATLVVSVSEEPELFAADHASLGGQLGATFSGSVHALAVTIRGLVIALAAIVPWALVVCLCATPIVLRARSRRRAPMAERM